MNNKLLVSRSEVDVIVKKWALQAKIITLPCFPGSGSCDSSFESCWAECWACCCLFALLFLFFFELLDPLLALDESESRNGKRYQYRAPSPQQRRSNSNVPAITQTSQRAFTPHMQRRMQHGCHMPRPLHVERMAKVDTSRVVYKRGRGRGILGLNPSVLKERKPGGLTDSAEGVDSARKDEETGVKSCEVNFS